MKKISMTTWVLIATVVGVALGVAVPEFANVSLCYKNAWTWRGLRHATNSNLDGR